MSTLLLDDKVVAIGNTPDGSQDLMPVTFQLAIGYDWDEKGGVFTLVNREGKVMKSIRVESTVEGLTMVIEMAEPHRHHGLLPPIVVEDTRRPMLTELEAQGFSVFVANSDALTLYRQVHGKMKKQKTDRHDAILLGQRFLNHPELHRNLAPISPRGLEIATLARMELEVTRLLVDAANRLRSRLAESNPATLRVWRAAQLTDGPTPCKWLLLFPTGSSGRALSEAEIDRHLKENGLGGGKRSAIAKKLYEAYQVGYLTYTPEIEMVVGRLIQEEATVILGLLERQARIEDRLKELVSGAYLTQLLEDATGLGPKTAARLIGQVGDDPSRFTNLRGFLAYAACVPYTEQSGSMQRNRRRRARGNELHATLRFWAEAAKHHHPGCREYYWKLRERGDFHQTALRKVMTKIARAFWHCLTTGEKWDDDRLWRPARPDLDDWIVSVQEKLKQRPKQTVTAR